VVTHVLLPSAAPFIATGIRIAAAVALIVTISAELLAGAASGVGSWILEMSPAVRTSRSSTPARSSPACSG
jgi:NitT/TauT family transport system permease protein